MVIEPEITIHLGPNVSKVHTASFLFLKLYLFVYFLAVLGLYCCAGFSLVVASGGYSGVAVLQLLIAGASLVVEQSLRGTQSSAVAFPGF